MTDSTQHDTLNELMSDIQTTADQLGVPVADRLWDVLRVYQQPFLEDPVGLRITTKDDELNVRYQTLAPQDPYARALEHGFLTRNGHPVHEVMVELQDKLPHAGYSVDLGVTHGLEKIWGFFRDPLTIEHTIALGSMPPSVGKHLDLFKQYELDWVCVIGVDYTGHTANLYFIKDAFPNSPAIARQFVVDAGFPPPPDVDNDLNGNAFTMYLTFSWDSDQIERISYALAGPAQAIPAHWPQKVHTFAAQVPIRAEERIFTYNTCYGRGVPDYYKVEADYRNSIGSNIGPIVEGNVAARNAAG